MTVPITHVPITHLEGTFGTITDDVRDAIGRLYKSSEKIASLIFAKNLVNN